MRQVIIALLALVLFSQTALAQTRAWADKLFGENTAHDFGVVPHGSQLKYSFAITNLYKEPLEIVQVRVSCGCVTATPGTKVLQSGEATTLNITMDATRFSGLKTVRVFMTVGPKYVSTATLSLTANARADVAFHPSEIDFGGVARGQTPTRHIDVEYTGSYDWRVLEIVKSSAAPFDMKVEDLAQQVSQSARRGYRIYATLKPDAPAGPFKQEIVLKTNDQTGPVLTFNINGAIQAALAATPSSMSVAGLKVGESQTKKIIVRGQRAFKIKSIEGLGNGITADIPDRQDTTMIVTVTVMPTQAGTLRRQLKILTDVESESATIVVDGEVIP